jgi:hypothetical protein
VGGVIGGVSLGVASGSFLKGADTDRQTC